MTLDEAWRKYLQDVEDVRQMFLKEDVIQHHPQTEGAAISLLHQTIALSYNMVMAPRQDYPFFYLQSYLDPYVYLGHLPCPDFVYRVLFLNGARTWRIWGKRNTSHWTDIQVHTGFWGSRVTLVMPITILMISRSQQTEVTKSSRVPNRTKATGSGSIPNRPTIPC
jgi:hypothetical protein